jgi:hypothetical protein
MSVNVPWLSRDAINQAATELLLGYEDYTGQILAPPIPVEDIIERYLELDLQYIDFYQRHGLDNVFGALYVKNRTVAVSESLLQDKNEGRLIFTCAHEVGHWCLHRSHVDAAVRVSGEAGVVLCRTGRTSKLPVEWQADYFAGCFLMPEEMVRGAWSRAFDLERDTLHICNVKKSFRTFVAPGLKSFDPCIENWHVIADIVRTAGNFSNVSKQSMIIRLQELGLVRNLTGCSMDWSCLQPDKKAVPE